MHRIGVTVFAVTLGVCGAGGLARAHEGHDQMGEAKETVAENTEAEQTLTGEVIDVVCYLGHGAKGQGHAGCAKKCIQSGLPVAIKVGDQLYLAAMADHTPANAALAEFSGQQVTVTGTVEEADGQDLVSITSVKKAD